MRRPGDLALHIAFITLHSQCYSQSIDISDEEIGNLVDSILNDDDINSDGYIDYYEFVDAQRRNRGEDV